MQTGSGKTYTMGTNYTGQNDSTGIIPQVMDSIFKKKETMKDTADFLIRVSFIEVLSILSFISLLQFTSICNYLVNHIPAK